MTKVKNSEKVRKSGFMIRDQAGPHTDASGHAAIGILVVSRRSYDGALQWGEGNATSSRPRGQMR